jgi:ATP-dependent Clp protease adaptor protein ClpS
MAVPLPLADQSRTPPAGDFVVELLNDGTTPFEFVIGAMERVFGMTGVDAVRITKAVHQDGRAVCAAFDSREAAQAKVDELAALAGVGNVPLKAVVRPARD